MLPALGELTVRQATVDDLVAHVEVRGTDEAATAVIKGDARMAEVLRRALYSHVTPPAEGVVVVRGSRRWRVPVYELEEIVRELLARDIRYGAAREALPQRIAHAVLVQMERAGEAPDDRVQNAVARNAAVKALVKSVWPQVDPARLVLRLLTDADFLAAHAAGVLTEDEQKALLWVKPARSVKSAKWSPADAVLIDEATDLIERTHSLGHVVLDEAQDLSPMQYRAVGRRCTTGSATVLGDLAQGTTPWATRSWAEALGHLGKGEAVVEELTAGFRVPTDVIAYASRLLPHIAPGLTPVASIRENPGFFDIRTAPDGAADVVAACRELLEREGSVGLIAADARVPELAAALAAAGVEAHAGELPGEFQGQDAVQPGPEGQGAVQGGRVGRTVPRPPPVGVEVGVEHVGGALRRRQRGTGVDDDRHGLGGDLGDVVGGAVAGDGGAEDEEVALRVVQGPGAQGVRETGQVGAGLGGRPEGVGLAAVGVPDQFRDQLVAAVEVPVERGPAHAHPLGDRVEGQRGGSRRGDLLPGVFLDLRAHLGAVPLARGAGARLGHGPVAASRLPPGPPGRERRHFG
ncbi:hypothetical protein STENM327S_04569 [Streptomyces tendae]